MLMDLVYRCSLKDVLIANQRRLFERALVGTLLRFHNISFTSPWIHTRDKTTEQKGRSIPYNRVDSFTNFFFSSTKR